MSEEYTNRLHSTREGCDSATLSPLRRGYWITQNAMIDEGHVAKMGPSAWTVWTCLRRHADQSMRCFPSEALLAKETGITRRHVHTMIHRLITLGYLVQEIQGGRMNRGSSSRYRVVVPSVSSEDGEIISQQSEISTQRCEIGSQHGVVKSEVEGCEIGDTDVVKPFHTKYTHKNNTQLRIPMGEECGEAASPPSPPPAAGPQVGLMTFPCVGGQSSTERQWVLTQEYVDKLKPLYPGIDVIVHCGRALNWCENNPTRRKTAPRMKQFLADWMAREQNRSGGRSAGGERKISGIELERQSQAHFRPSVVPDAIAEARAARKAAASREVGSGSSEPKPADRTAA